MNHKELVLNSPAAGIANICAKDPLVQVAVYPAQDVLSCAMPSQEATAETAIASAANTQSVQSVTKPDIATIVKEALAVTCRGN